MDYVSSTLGPALDPSRGEGDFDSIRDPYVFTAQQGLLCDRILCISIVIHAMLDLTREWRRILISQGLRRHRALRRPKVLNVPLGCLHHVQGEDQDLRRLQGTSQNPLLVRHFEDRLRAH
jgi:hypothetical protein